MADDQPQDDKPQDDKDEDKDDKPKDGGRHHVGDDKQTGKGPGEINPRDYET